MSNLEYGQGQYILSKFDYMSERSRALFFTHLFSGTIDANRLINFVLAWDAFDKSSYQSPIEEIFALAYRLHLLEYDKPYEEIIPLYPQEKINIDGKIYFADFLIDPMRTEWVRYETNDIYRLVIECDGHDFHEKTKAQVERRNERDMDLKSAGYDVLHFSGSQIYRDPDKCAEDVFEYVIQKVGEVTM